MYSTTVQVKYDPLKNFVKLIFLHINLTIANIINNVTKLYKRKQIFVHRKLALDCFSDIYS